MLSDKQIEELWVDIHKGKFMSAGFNTFARAIESAVLPEGLVAVSVATLQKRRDDSYSCKLLCDDLLAAAPKAQAEKQEPVKDEPVALVDFNLPSNINFLCDRGLLLHGTKLYTRPQPDLTAEVERLKLSAEHWNRLYREKCQEFHDAQANKGQEIVWLIDRIAELEALVSTREDDIRTEKMWVQRHAERIAELEEAAREARDAIRRQPYTMDKDVCGAIAKLDGVLGNVELTGSRAGSSPVSPATEGSEVERRVGGAVSPAPTFGDKHGT